MTPAETTPAEMTPAEMTPAEMTPAETTPAGHALDPAEVDAFYRVAGARRDVRNGFLPDPVDDEVLTRVLAAAHQAPSVGLSQPWDFLILREREARDREVRARVQRLAQAQRDAFAATLPWPRALAFRAL